jgi:quinol monooxygenase YgiN
MEQQLQNTIQQISTMPIGGARERMMFILDSGVSRLRTQTQKEKGNLKYNKRYSREEKDAIKFMTEKGSTDEEIAQHLKRSVKGIIQQRQKLISVENPALSKQLVSNWSPSNPDPSFIIPQHTSM